MHADDGLIAAFRCSENHYFHCPGECTLILPTGDARLQVSAWLGLQHYGATRRHHDRGNTTTISLEPLRRRLNMATSPAHDLHVHMNYGGHYHNTPQNLIEQARAEHLDAVYNLIVNKEKSIPDVAQFSARPLRKDNCC